MKCPICKNGETETKLSMLTLAKGEAIFVYKNVPSEACNNCGETFTDESTTSKLLDSSYDSISAGTILNVKDYRAA